MTGHYEEATVVFKELLERAQKGEFILLWAHNYLASIYAMKGDLQKARFHASEVLKLDPNFSLDSNRQTTFFKNPAHQEPILESLGKAGIPEHPPKGSWGLLICGIKSYLILSILEKHFCSAMRYLFRLNNM